MRSLRLTTVGLVAAAVAVLALLLAPSAPTPASAGLVDATCTSTGTLVFDPGLTLTAKPTDWTGTGSYSPCVSGEVVSGAFSGGGHGELNCLGGSTKAALTIDWTLRSGGTARSQIEFEVKLAVGPNGGLSAALDGNVTAGLFEGDEFRGTFVSIATDPLQCLTRGGARVGMGVGAAVFMPA